MSRRGHIRRRVPGPSTNIRDDAIQCVTGDGIDGRQAAAPAWWVPLVVVVEQRDHRAARGVDAQLSASGRTAANSLRSNMIRSSDGSGTPAIRLRDNDDLGDRYVSGQAPTARHGARDGRPIVGITALTLGVIAAVSVVGRKCTAQNNSAMQAYSAIMLYVHGA